MSHPFKDFATELWEDESGGCGGIFKSILRIVVPIAVSFIPGAGPLLIAASSALTTVATGGSFTEALLAGATSFIGSSITQGISGGLGSLESSAGFFSPLDDAFSSGISGGIGSSIANSVSGAAISGASLLSDVVSPAFLAANAELIGRTLGGLATLTLNQALNSNIPGLTEELDQTFGSDATASLQQQARDAQLEEVFQGLIGQDSRDVNPFLSEGQTPNEAQTGLNDFAGVIARGLRRQDESLGLDVTQSQFDEVFQNPNLRSNILGEERGIVQQGFTDTLGQTFTGDAFGDIDDDIINSIISERQGPAQQQISNFEARGNLNPLGGKTANEFIQGQIPTASDRLREIGSGVQQTNQAGVNDIRDRAQQGIGAFNLGDDLFNQEPFNVERSNLITERQGSLRDDLFSSLGSEPLFNVSGALNEAGRAQGVVSGAPNASLLDAIAARETGGGTQRRRGLGSRGSGTF